MERTIESLSMTLAVSGMCSQICTSPAVEMGRNGPPVLAPGLRSQMSIVEGPPLIHSRMADFLFRFSVSALAIRLLPSVRAGIVRAEAPAMCDMKWRRLMPEGVENMVDLEKSDADGLG